jgi:hypothetical protein
MYWLLLCLPTRMNAETSKSANAGPRHSPIYGLQVQAFLDAADDVDADEDVLEDLLDGFDDKPHAHDGERRLDVDDAFEVGENDGLDDSDYNALVHEGGSHFMLRSRGSNLLYPISRSCLDAARSARHEASSEGKRHVIHPYSEHLRLMCI